MIINKDKILIVEDDKTSQVYYSAILGDLYDLTLVPTAEMASEALQQDKFKLAIIDISLPGGEDGISLIKYIRKEYTDELPLIVITAHAFPEVKKEALEAGVVEFFTKPIMSGDLLEVVGKYLLVTHR